MERKRILKNTKFTNFEVERKVWKNDGAEQQLLEKLFKNGTITNQHSASMVRNLNPLFEEFSTQVFYNHFKKTKDRIGIKKANVNYDAIPEIDGEPDLVYSTEIENSLSNTDLICSKKFEISHAEFLNPPITKWIMVDHKEKCQKVFVALAMVAGATNVKFEISETGQEISIMYSWPKAMFAPEQIFQSDDKENNDNSILIHSYVSALLENGITDKTNPQAVIKIELPIPVQKDLGSWKKSGVTTKDGSKIVLLEFKGFQNQQIITEADKSICFD